MEQQFTGTGTDNQYLILEYGGFSVSDRDVVVTVDNVQLQVVHGGGVFYYPNVPEPSIAVQDITTTKGRTILLFGTDDYG